MGASAARSELRPRDHRVELPIRPPRGVSRLGRGPEDRRPSAGRDVPQAERETRGFMAAAEHEKTGPRWEPRSSNLRIHSHLRERATGLEPATSSLGRRPVYGPLPRYGTVLQRVTTSTPRPRNGRSGPENGLGGPTVNPRVSTRWTSLAAVQLEAAVTPGAHPRPASPRVSCRASLGGPRRARTGAARPRCAPGGADHDRFGMPARLCPRGCHPRLGRPGCSAPPLTSTSAVHAARQAASPREPPRSR